MGSHRTGSLQVRLVLACLIGAVGIGCADKSAGPGFADGEKLPPIEAGSALPVDEGRVAVASPKGWVRASRSKDYLVRYQRAAKKEFPSVTVTVGDAPDGLVAVTPDNQKQFVEAVAGKLAETFTKKGKSTLTVEPRAVRLGDRIGVAWASPGKAGSGTSAKPIDRVTYAVVIDGRQYAVEARGLKGKLEPADKLAAKAVASSLAIPKPSEPQPEPEPDEPISEPKTEATTEPKPEPKPEEASDPAASQPAP